MAKRGTHDREVVDDILDEALVSHLGIVDPAGFPVVIPTLHARVGGHVLIHGSAASRTLSTASRSEACLTVTLVDGLVLARSAFHHSVNYRSVVIFGSAEPVESAADKRLALEAFTEKLVPRRWDDVRQPAAKELKATSVLRLSLDEASAKIRYGPPVDDEADYDLPIWAGTVGLRLRASEPEPDTRTSADIACPDYVVEFVESQNDERR